MKQTSSNYIHKAKKILKDSPYLVLATILKNGQPWNSPVWTAHDKDYNFYWSSQKSSQHSKNIKIYPHVFGVVYNPKTAYGVYMKGKAYEITGEVELEHALRVFYRRKGKDSRQPEDFLGKKPRRIYRFTPKKFWMNTFGRKDGFFIDGRVEIKL